MLWVEKSEFNSVSTNKSIYKNISPRVVLIDILLRNGSQWYKNKCICRNILCLETCTRSERRRSWFQCESIRQLVRKRFFLATCVNFNLCGSLIDRFTSSKNGNLRQERYRVKNQSDCRRLDTVPSWKKIIKESTWHLACHFMTRKSFHLDTVFFCCCSIRFKMFLRNRVVVKFRHEKTHGACTVSIQGSSIHFLILKV